MLWNNEKKKYLRTDSQYGIACLGVVNNMALYVMNKE